MPNFQHMVCNTNKVVEAQWWRHADSPGWSRVSIRKSMSSARNGVGLWIRLCATELLRVYGAEVCHCEKGYAEWIEEAEHEQKRTVTQVQAGNGKSVK